MLGVFTFGRFNPPTIGHRRLVDRLVELSEGQKPFIFVSATEDRRNNPVPLEIRLKAMRAAFRDVEVVGARTVFEAFPVLAEAGVDRAVLVIGEDRAGTLGERVVAYSGRDEVCGLEVRLHVLDRAPGVTSATMARAAARRGDYALFRRLVPFGEEVLSGEVYRAVRHGLGAG